MTAIAVGLRRWAAGSATDAAAVELLALVAGGRLLSRSSPWVQPCGRLGWFWLDPEQLVLLQARLVGVDRHLVALVIALLTNGRTRQTTRSSVEVAA